MSTAEQSRHDLTDGGYVRFNYRVPAYRDGRVVVDGEPGTISGFDGQYLLVRFDDEAVPVPAHPTWRVEYLAPASDPQGGAR